MTPKEIKTMRESYLASVDKTKIGGLDSFWLSEIALHLSYTNELLEKLLKDKTKESKPARVRLPGSRTRKYYAIEYVPSVPVHLDWVGCDKPQERWHHEIMAKSSEDARVKLIARLTKEREQEQEQYAQKDLDKKAS